MKSSRSRSIRLVTAISLAGVMVAGCSSSSKGTTTSAKSATSTMPSTSAAAGDIGNSAAALKYALSYTGGSAGAATGSMSPIVVGFATNKGGTIQFPHTAYAADAAISYINRELGGVRGHPIDLITCPVTNSEDATACGTQFANNSQMQAVVIGGIATGHQGLYQAIGGKKPILLAAAGALEDFTATNAYNYTPEGPTIVTGAIQWIAKDQKAKSVAIISSNNAVGTSTMQQIVLPYFKAQGIPTKISYVSDTATEPDYASAVQASGAATADFLYLFPGATSGCIAADHALSSMNAQTKVVVITTCMSTSVAKDLGGQFPNGWYFSTDGYNVFFPASTDDPASLATAIFKAKLQQYQPNGDFSGSFAMQTFAVVMTLHKFLNQLGPDNITAPAVNDLAKNFTGPMWAEAGPIKCGYNPAFPAFCDESMGIEQFVNGKWVAVADAYNHQQITPFAGK